MARPGSCVSIAVVLLVITYIVLVPAIALSHRVGYVETDDTTEVVVEVCLEDNYYADDRIHGCFQVVIELPAILTVNDSSDYVGYSVIVESIGGYSWCKAVFSTIIVYDLSTGEEVATISLDNQVTVDGGGEVCIGSECSTSSISGIALFNVLVSKVEEIAGESSDVYLELYGRPGVTVWSMGNDVTDEFSITYNDIDYGDFYFILKSDSDLLYTVTKTTTIYKTIYSTMTETKTETMYETIEYTTTRQYTETQYKTIEYRETYTVTTCSTETKTLWRTVYGGTLTKSYTETETIYKTKTTTIEKTIDPSPTAIAFSLVIIVTGLLLFTISIRRR